MGKILQFPDLDYPPKEQVQANEQWLLPGYILIAWGIVKYGSGDVVTAWYLPENGERWVYKRNYDAKTMKIIEDAFARISCHDAYQWLKEPSHGLFREFYICAPLYILLDNKQLRAEYLAGNLEKIS
jgi:hypothetical protein